MRFQFAIHNMASSGKDGERSFAMRLTMYYGKENTPIRYTSFSQEEVIVIASAMLNAVKASNEGQPYEHLYGV